MPLTLTRSGVGKVRKRALSSATSVEAATDADADTDAETHAEAEAAEADGRGPDERTGVAEAGGDDSGAEREVQSGRPVDLGLGGGEERFAEAERHRAGDDGELQVEQVGDRRHCPADQPAGPLHDVGR